MEIVNKENVVTDNLVVHLDADNRDSYSGSGTTWSDLSGNGNNGTLNTTAIDYNKESLIFNGNNEYINFSQYDFGNEFTLQCFIKPSNLSNIRTLFANSSVGSTTNGIRLFINFENANTRTLHIELGNGSSGLLISTDAIITYDTWQHVAFTLNKNTLKGIIYHNGIKVKEETLSFINYKTNAAFQFGTIGGAYYYGGALANYLLYNRELTPSEIQQNYDNQKGRFFEQDPAVLEFPPNYWIKWGTINEGRFNTITYHDKNNIYLCGDSSTTKNALIKKIDSTGKCKWIKQLGDGINTTSIFSADTDSFGNLYVSPITYYTTDRNFVIAKYDPSGTLLWQKKLDLTGSNANSSLKVSPTNYIYICGWTNQAGAGGEDLLVMKLDLSGNILWQKTLGSVGVELGYTLTLDSNENIIVSVYTGDNIVTVKYDSLGTLQWQRTFGKVKAGIYDEETGPGVVTDSNDNIYIVGYESATFENYFGGTTYAYYGIVLKYNSSGVLQWQKTAVSEGGSFGYSTLFFDIKIDSNDNLYIVGDTTFYRYPSTNWYPAYIAKLNTSGVVQWERGLVSGLSGTYQYALSNTSYSIEIDEYGDLYIAGSTNYRSNNIFNDYWPLIFKVPGDGSLLGLYSPFQYGSDSITYSNGTYTDAAENYTESTTNFSFIDSTLTSSSISCSTIDNFIEITDYRETLTFENM